MTRFVVVSAVALALGAMLVGRSAGMDAFGTTCLGFLSAFGVLLVGGWVDSFRNADRVR